MANVMDDILQDVRFALRQMRTSPVFTATAILTLALGIGANTAVFSALNTLLLKMLPVRAPQQIYNVVLVNGGTQPPNSDGTGNGNTSFSYPVFAALRQQTRVFSDLIAHVPLGFGKVAVRYGKIPTEKSGEEVSGNFFSGLGVPMERGIAFTPMDERKHSSVVVLSYSFWTRGFSRDPHAIGRTLYIKGVPFTIVGVAAPAFYGVQPGTAVDFWIPLQNRPELNAWGMPSNKDTLFGTPNWWALPMLARLRPGISPEQAQQALQPVLWQAASIGVGTLDPKRWPAHLGFLTIRGIPNYARSDRAPIEMMMGLVGLVLLIACTNVAMLITARNAAREREFAMRIAVGARTLRLFRQLLTESVLLVVTGAGFGWLLALGATRALAAWARVASGFAPDRRVLLFTLAIAALSAVAFGLVPLWTTLRIATDAVLKGNTMNASQGRGAVRGGNAAIAAQIAMCLTLLVAAGLTVRTLLRYEHQDLGMQATQLLVFDVNRPDLKDKAQAISFYRTLLDRVKSAPGVETASLVRLRPGSGWSNSGTLKMDGKNLRDTSGSRSHIYFNYVGPGFFHTLGVPVLQGRDITEDDTAGSAGVAVVNETFARKFLPHGAALGHVVGDQPGAEIVGVVKDSKYRSGNERPLPIVYYPLLQGDMQGQVTVEVRVDGNPLALLPTMQRIVSQLDPDLPLQNPMTEAMQFSAAYVTPRLFARLALAFGILATILVAIGLYGTLAYRVQRRTSEIGIRMALGAQRGNVLWMVLRESLLVAAFGIAVGLPISFLVAHLMRAQLYHLNYLDPASFAIALTVTLLVVLGAAYLPARKASSVDPAQVLRSE